MNRLQLGEVVSGVRPVEMIARSRSSEIYRGVDIATGELVAVKVLANGGDAESVNRFRREAELLADVDHPHVVRFRNLHADADGGLVMIVTDWIDGMTLGELMSAPMRIDQALHLAGQLAGAIDHLNDRGIVHRDLTPANVMVSDADTDDPGATGRVTLIDLGIGHRVDARTMTRDDLLAGTPRYLAPEIIRGERSSARSDQYSLAVIVHEMIGGAPLFGQAEELATTLHHQLNTMPQPLDETDASVPSVVADAVLRGLDKVPDRRHDTSTSFIDAAAGVAADGEGSRRRPTGTTRTRRRMTRRTRALVAVAGIAVVTLGVFVAIDQRRDGPDARDGVADETVESSTDQRVWASGNAASLSCNLLTGVDFEDGVIPTDFYPDPPATERVVAHGGIDDTAVLEVGRSNQWALYGEMVPVLPGRSYVFSGWFDEAGDVGETELGVVFLDRSYEQAGVEVTASFDAASGDIHLVRTESSPPDAAFAVPFVFKDASPGVLLADELVFGSDASCNPTLGTATDESAAST